MKMPAFKTPAEVAKTFGCSIKQARKQIEKSRAGILGMLIKCRQTGKKVNGYTEGQLELMAQGYNRALAVSNPSGVINQITFRAVSTKCWEWLVESPTGQFIAGGYGDTEADVRHVFKEWSGGAPLIQAYRSLQS